VSRALPDDLTGRLVQLIAGLAAFGLSMALMIEADLGLGPWDVFHQGLARRLPITVGIAVIATAAVVLLLWIPLRQRPGIGTWCNMALIGLFVDGFLVILPTPDGLAIRSTLLIAGIVLNGAATGFYIGAGLGPGPRDGLMTGLARNGRSIRVVRTGIELIVLAIGWLLGGTLGIGTMLFAFGIGPLAHIFLPIFDRRRSRRYLRAT